MVEDSQYEIVMFLRTYCTRVDDDALSHPNSEHRYQSALQLTALRGITAMTKLLLRLRADVNSFRHGDLAIGMPLQFLE